MNIEYWLTLDYNINCMTQIRSLSSIPSLPWLLNFTLLKLLPQPCLVVALRSSSVVPRRDPALYLVAILFFAAPIAIVEPEPSSSFAWRRPFPWLCGSSPLCLSFMAHSLPQALYLLQPNSLLLLQPNSLLLFAAIAAAKLATILEANVALAAADLRLVAAGGVLRSRAVLLPACLRGPGSPRLHPDSKLRPVVALHRCAGYAASSIWP